MKGRVLLIGALLLSCTSLSARADEPGKEPLQLQTVTVTANKLSEDMQKVPQSISVMDAAEVRDSGIKTVRDLGNRIPNLTFASPGSPMISLPVLRGVQTNPHGNVPGVILYVDDVPVTANLGYVAQLYDIESIEVLRGPQGALYGANAEGGIIKVTTRKPSAQTHGSVGFEAGSKNHVMGTASLSGELIKEVLYAGGAFRYHSIDGWVENDYEGDDDFIDNRRSWSGRGTLLFTPTDKLSINLTADGTKFDGGSFGMYLPMPGMDKRHVNVNDSGYNRDGINSQSLTINYELTPHWTFTAVSTRRELNADYDIDYDFMPIKMFEMNRFDNYKSFGQELRATYDNEGYHAVIGGMYSFNERSIKYEYYNANMYHEAKDFTNSYALFGQIKIPFADHWAVTLGGRLEHYRTDFKDNMANFTDSDSWLTFSPKLALEYNFTDENMIYASVSRGFKAGGYDSFQGSSGNYKYDEEELWAVELGTKNLFWDNRIRLNAALFYHKYRDMQMETYYNTPMGPMPAIKNVGDPEAFGGELELSVYPLPGIEIFGSVGYTHMRHDDFKDALGNHTGNHIPYVPEWTYSAGVQYRHEAGFYARAEMNGTSKAYLDSQNDGYIPAHTLFNAKVGWEFENGFDLYAYINNIFDQRYDYVRAFGGTYGVATEGMTCGAGVAYRF